MLRSRAAVALLLVLWTALPATAHEEKAVSGLDKALAELLPSLPDAERDGLTWMAMPAERVAKIDGVTSFKMAHLEVDGAPASLAHFDIAGQWGPVEVVALAQGTTLAGLRVLSFTEHSGSEVAEPSFAAQFEGVALADLDKAVFKAPKKEPKTLEGIVRGLRILAKMHEMHQKMSAGKGSTMQMKHEGGAPMGGGADEAGEHHHDESGTEDHHEGGGHDH